MRALYWEAWLYSVVGGAWYHKWPWCVWSGAGYRLCVCSVKVSIEELVAVVEVKLASLEGAFGVGSGGSKSSPAGGALYLCSVVCASVVVGGVWLG